ncbi:MAG: class II fumarate hydratase [Gammaproteobacteria bacterium]
MSQDAAYRIERDSMGEIRVPREVLYGAQTQRAVDNFRISEFRMPGRFIHALGLIKACAAEANAGLGTLDGAIASAITAAALEVADGVHDAHFPVDVFQTGSGTSTHMNANEVIARLAANRLGRPVHPNDHVNLGQSSNDVIPTAIHVSALLACRETLMPALDDLIAVIERRADGLADSVKTGRTHLMDALPVTFGQELGGWSAQLQHASDGVRGVLPRLMQVAQGGTAAGTGVTAHPLFAQSFAAILERRSDIAFRPSGNFFAAISSQDTVVELSGQLRVIAVGLQKIANDLRWMNSGPRHGLAEIRLPALQPGSSIMPGKINPVIPEAVAMAYVQVMGNDAAIALAAQSGNFQLNTMLPLIGYNLLQNIGLLASSARALGEKALAGFTVNAAHVQAALDTNPVLVTALTGVLGYEKCAEIARRAYVEGRPVREIAQELTGLSAAELERLLDPLRLTRPAG